MSERSQIVKGAIISYVAILINIAISLIYTPWMIHQIGVSDYGLYSLVGAFISYFILDFGLSNTITRFVAKYRAEGDERKVENVLGLTARLYFVIDVVIFVVLAALFFFIEDIFKGLTTDEIYRMKYLYCIAGIFSILSFVFKPVPGAMNAYEYFAANKTMDLIIRVGTVLLTIVALLCGGDVYVLVFINGVVGFVVAVIRFVYFRRRSKLNINWGYFSKAELIELFSFSVWILLMSLVGMFRLNLIPTVLGIESNTTEISIFSVGRNLEGFVYTFSAALNGLFLPKVTRIAIANNRQSLMELMVRVGRIQLYLISLILFGFGIFGSAFINLWVGPEFSPSFWVFILLILTNIVSLTLQIAMDTVYAENRIKGISIITLISAPIGLIIAWVLAPRYGALGCAIGSGIGLILTQLMNVIFFHKKMDFNMAYFFVNCHLKILPVLIVYSIIAYFIRQMFTINSWVTLIAGIAIYSVIYCAIVYFFLFNKDEKSLVIGLIPSKFKKH